MNCLNDPGADSKFGKDERKTVECPEWAREGCYTGAAEHDYVSFTVCSQVLNKIITFRTETGNSKSTKVAPASNSTM